jgi:hypothetical protein
VCLSDDRPPIEIARAAKLGGENPFAAIEELVMDDQRRELQIGTATSAILVSLLQTLVAKEVLSNAEVRGLLTKAANDLGPHGYAAPYEGGIGVILDDVLPKFPEDGGD